MDETVLLEAVKQTRKIEYEKKAARENIVKHILLVLGNSSVLL